MKIMQNNILKKIARFVELSKEFSVKESDVYEGFELPQQYGHLVINTTGNVGMTFHAQSTEKSPTKNEAFKKFLKNKKEVVDRWEEYKDLREKLSQYFESLNNLK